MNDYKEEVRTRLKRARALKSIAAIGRDVGIPSYALSKFLELKYLSTNKLRALDEYLISLLADADPLIRRAQISPPLTLQAELDWYRSGRIFAATSGLPGEANNIEVIYQCDSVGTVLGETLGEFYDRKIKGKE